MNLISAFQNGDIEQFENLLQNKEMVVDAFKWACQNGLAEIAHIMIDCGVDIHVEDDYGLNRAFIRNHLEVFKLLLEHGAEVHADNQTIVKWLPMLNQELEIVGLVKKLLLLDKINQLNLNG
jgi:ankyrin repeat protein